MTDEHMMLLADGTPVAAQDIKVGDTMLVLGASSAPTSASRVKVTAIGRWKGGIINPLTHSGTILASSPSRAEFAGAGVGHTSTSFVLATTVFASPGDALLTMTRMPSFFKLGSFLFPRQLQDSRLVETASELVAAATLLLNRHVHHHNDGNNKNANSSSGSSASVLIARTSRAAVKRTVHGLSIGIFLLFDITIGLSFVLYHMLHGLFHIFFDSLLPASATVSFGVTFGYICACAMSTGDKTKAKVA